MAIERDAGIKFHEWGTLNAVTRWISSHDEGIAEWLKNVRRAYQPDRANVLEGHRAAVLLIKDEEILAKDEKSDSSARIGLLDVGGATLEDVTAWSTWQDPRASGRGADVAEEETQGNGGKAYMYRLFIGPAMICGVSDDKRNAKGFEGAAGTLDRGVPGFMPDVASGREAPVASVSAELSRVLAPYGIGENDLPSEVRSAIAQRRAFTLVEAVAPVNLGPAIDAEDLVEKIVRHDQSTLAVQQLRLYAFHNSMPMNGGKPIQLPPVEAYPGLEGPFICEVPESLALPDGGEISTTEGGNRGRGRLILCTSRENMPNAWKKLKPLWKISYRTQHQMIGAKPVSDLVPTMPGSQYIFGRVELPALEPTYVEHGRRRPKDGPLVEALDQFIADQIRAVAKQITDRRKRDLDEHSLDEVQEENRKLDRFKNQFLPSDGQGEGDVGGSGPGPNPPPPPPGPVEWGDTPDSIELLVPEGGLVVARGVDLRLNPLLQVRVRDVQGKPVRAGVEWHTGDQSIARVMPGDHFEARNKGQTEIWATVRMRGGALESEHVPVDVWIIDHVLLTPRTIELPLGKREDITAEVTNDDGARSANVYLKWSHDADDQLIVRISPTGSVRGNRIGETSVSAGAGDPASGGVWARIPVRVTVTPNPDMPGTGSGFPRLLLTGRDIDPDTGAVREGDPDSPALWQEPADFLHNIWWINLQSPEAAFAFGSKGQHPELWRSFHAQLVMEMVIQVHMQSDYTRRGEGEQPELWVMHRGAVDRHRVRLIPQMWEKLESYVESGGGLDQ